MSYGLLGCTFLKVKLFTMFHLCRLCATIGCSAHELQDCIDVKINNNNDNNSCTHNYNNHRLCAPLCSSLVSLFHPFSMSRLFKSNLAQHITPLTQPPAECSNS